MRRLYLGMFVAAWMSQLLTPVFALNDTIGVTTGAGKTANLIKFGSNNVISEVGICDATTENQCAAVSAGGAVKVDGSAVTQPVSGTFWQSTQPVSAVSLPLPTGAATAAGLTTINTTLGSPFQAGGSIGNTTFAATQGTSSNLKAQVDPLTSASWALGAFGATMPTNGQGIGLFDGSNMVRAKGDETNGIWVNIKSGAGSGGTALPDANAFTQGPAGTNTTPLGCLYTTSVTNLTTGEAGVARCTNDRQQLVSDAALLTAAQAGTIVDNATFTQGTTSVIMIGCQYNTSITNLSSGSGGAPQCTIDRKVQTASFNGGSTYNTIAASQTAQALTGGGGGATGDYLSHCIIYPTSTTPGAVTVFDNTNTAGNSAILFPGGASSVSNLVPIAIPVGAKSVNGPWKVTTVANESAVCFGKFT